MAYTNESSYWNIPEPGPEDTPIDLVDLFEKRDVLIDKFGQIDAGPLSGRAVSTPASPGVRRRLYVTTDQAPGPRLDIDYGTGWITAGPDSASRTLTLVRVHNAFSLFRLAGWTFINFDALVDDVGINWKTDASALPSWYQVPAAGVYRLEAQLGIVMPNVGDATTVAPGTVNLGNPQLLGLKFQKNGVDQYTVTKCTAVANKPNVPESISIFFSTRCAAGDKIRLFALTDYTADSIDVLSGNMTIVRQHV